MDSLPTVSNTTTFDQIAQIIGQDMPSSNTRVGHPRLTVTMRMTTVPIPAGSFFVNSPNGAIYAKTMDFQLFIQRYQYLHYDAEVNEMVSKSIMANNLYPQTEIPDTVGTCAVGLCQRANVIR